jgi:hypothetical protein
LEFFLNPVFSGSGLFKQNSRAYKHSMDQFWMSYLSSHSIRNNQVNHFMDMISRFSDNLSVTILDYSNPVFLNSLRFSGTTFSIYRFSLKITGEYSDVLKFIHQLLSTKYIRLSDHFEIQSIKPGSTEILFLGNFQMVVRSKK